MAETEVSRRTVRNQSTVITSTRTSGLQRTTPRAAPLQRLARAVGNSGMNRLLRSPIQRQLTVGPADDEYEREADRVADEVMRMPDPSENVVQRAPVQIQRMCPECEDELQRQPVVVRRASTLVQRKCPACEKAAHRPEEHAGATMQRSELDSVESDGERVQIQRMCRECEDELQRSPFGIRRQPTDFVFESVEEDERLQAKAVAGPTPQVTPEMESQLAGLQGRGQQCPAAVRAYFEPRLGYDLSPVRIHTDARAYEMARAVRARAFTLGPHIVFGEGQHAPATSEGRRLLAHELTHTIQQRAVSQKASARPGMSSGSPIASSEALRLSLQGLSTAQLMIQKADCNFYVYDSTESSSLGTSWKLAAIGLAMKARGGYYVPSGNSIEEMLHRVLSGYAEEDCDCIEEIQFLSHGSSGNAMYISKSGDELTVADFNIPEIEKYGDGPRDTEGYRSWHSKLTPRQRRLVLLRRVLCGPGAEVYYRSCSAFQGKTGQEFAKASAKFWRAKVIGHTKIIGLSQPGQKTVKPGEEPGWPESEGTEEPQAKKPIGIGAGQKPKKD